MRSLQAIVFDLDDTLYPESAYVVSGFHSVARWAAAEHGIPEAEGLARLTELYHSRVRGNTFNLWLEPYGLADDAIIAQAVAVYRAHLPTLTPFPGVLALLERLRTRYRLGLVSDGYLDVQRRKFAALNLAACFHAVVFSDQWGRDSWKPSQRPFREVLTLLDVAAEHALYIGDNPLKDFLGARQVGLLTIWLRRPDGEYSHQSPPTPDHAAAYTIESLEALEAWLAG